MVKTNRPNSDTNTPFLSLDETKKSCKSNGQSLDTTKYFESIGIDSFELDHSDLILNELNLPHNKPLYCLTQTETKSDTWFPSFIQDFDASMDNYDRPSMAWCVADPNKVVKAIQQIKTKHQGIKIETKIKTPCDFITQLSNAQLEQEGIELQSFLKKKEQRKWNCSVLPTIDKTNQLTKLTMACSYDLSEKDKSKECPQCPSLSEQNQSKINTNTSLKLPTIGIIDASQFNPKMQQYREMNPMGNNPIPVGNINRQSEQSDIEYAKTHLFQQPITYQQPIISQPEITESDFQQLPDIPQEEPDISLLPNVPKEKLITN